MDSSIVGTSFAKYIEGSVVDSSRHVCLSVLKVLQAIDLKNMQHEELSYRLKKLGDSIQTETLSVLSSLEDGELIYKVGEMGVMRTDPVDVCDASRQTSRILCTTWCDTDSPVHTVKVSKMFAIALLCLILAIVIEAAHRRH